MIGSKITAMYSIGLQMDVFCLVVEFHRRGSATHGATLFPLPSSNLMVSNNQTKG